MRRTTTGAALAATLAAGALALTAVGGEAAQRDLSAVSRLPRGSERVSLRPADFTTTIDNPYWPMKPGTRWVYRETEPDGSELRVVVR